ncbi:MAG: hypothetical protein QW794_04200 [Thermosphaera sp.]
MDLTSFLRLSARWGREVLIAPGDGCVRVLALNIDRTAGVEYVMEGVLEGAVRVDAYQLPRDFESAEVRGGRLIVRVNGEEVALGEPTDMKWNPPRAEKWYGFPLEAFREVLKFAEWKRERWRERGRRLLEDYCLLEVKGEKLFIRACGRMFFAELPGCTEELKVSVRLSNIAEVLKAFEMAGLKPGSIAFTRREGGVLLVQLRGGWLRAYVAPFIE